MTHHEFGPSNFPAWAQCPCYRRTNTGNKEATAGTDAHQQLHDALVNGTTPENDAAAWAAEWVKAQNPKNLQSEIEVRSHNDSTGDIFGTVDIIFEDGDGVIHIADFKTFSDGTIDYLPQLRAYASLVDGQSSGAPVVLHVLHGMSRKSEDEKTCFGECLARTVDILDRVRSEDAKPCLCKWCQYCSKLQTCQQSNNAVQVVSDNSVAFSRLSLCQKLVVLDTVDKLSKAIREEAKATAIANGGVLEMDGIRYEMKPWAGTPKVHNLCEVAEAVASPKYLKVNEKKQTAVEVSFDGLSHEELLSLCDLGKSKLADALIAKNPGATKSDIKKYVEQFYDKTEGAPHFVRVN